MHGEGDANSDEIWMISPQPSATLDCLVMEMGLTGEWYHCKIV